MEGINPHPHLKSEPRIPCMHPCQITVPLKWESGERDMSGRKGKRGGHDGDGSACFPFLRIVTCCTMEEHLGAVYQKRMWGRVEGNEGANSNRIG